MAFEKFKLVMKKTIDPGNSLGLNITAKLNQI
jgi:hypothetical protein